MTTADDFTAFTLAGRRRTLQRARADRKIAAGDLDRLLVEACRSGPRLRSLAMSLADVEVQPGGPLDEALSGDPPLGASLAAARDADHFGLYAEQVRALPRLAREQEHGLARRLEFARERMGRVLDATRLPADARERVLDRGLSQDGLRSLMADAWKPGLDPARRTLLAQRLLRAAADYGELRGRFVERNLYLVIGMSAAYRSYGLPVMDLIQEGNAALIRAVEKFDWRKDVRFQTYAAWWIRQAVERLITANRNIVRVPNYIQQKMRRLKREGRLPRNHRDMDVRDVSQLFDTSAMGAARLMETDRSWFSLDVRFDEDDEPFGATLAADEAEGGLSPTERRALGRRLDEVMQRHLTAQERSVLTQRFGLDGGAPRTLDEIGDRMHVSRERVRQMQVKALDKLQRPQLLGELGDFL